MSDDETTDDEPVESADTADDEAPDEDAWNDLEEGIGESARCARLRTSLRDARRRLRRLEAESQALREELLNAGEMIETLALDLERATLGD